MTIVPLRDLGSLPKASGIYLVLAANDEVVYVGQTQNIRDRWKNGHHKLADIVSEYGNDIRIKCVAIPQWLLNRAEHSAILRHKPKLNRRTPPIV